MIPSNEIYYTSSERSKQDQLPRARYRWSPCLSPGMVPCQTQDGITLGPIMPVLSRGGAPEGILSGAHTGGFFYASVIHGGYPPRSRHRRGILCRSGYNRIFGGPCGGIRLRVIINFPTRKGLWSSPIGIFCGENGRDLSGSAVACQCRCPFSVYDQSEGAWMMPTGPGDTAMP